jgi:zinc protease
MRLPLPLRGRALALGALGALGAAAPALAAAQAAPPAPPPAPPAAPPAATGLPSIPHETFTLPNGLTVLLARDSTVPTVAVDVWYHVGSKNEVAGRTGFAHLFEHVMFTGSGHVPYGTHDRMTEGVGGMNNGSTNNDRTNYYEVVPSNYLQTALWLEADRMGWLLDSLDVEKFRAQRAIVQNERRQSYENQPYGLVSEIMAGALYPSGHPYSWPVVGFMRDLEAATVDDVKQFFRTWYAPNNATLAIVGDFDADSARAWVRRWFGDIPQGPAIKRAPVPAATLAAEKRLVHEDRVQVPRLYLRWPTVSTDHQDRHALEILGSILAGPRTARLTKALVYDAQVAAAVSAGQGTNEDAGTFGVVVTPRPNNSLTALEASVDSIIARLKAEGPTADELTRTKAGMEYELVSSLESPLGKAEMLLEGQVYHGDPSRFQKDLAALQAVTAADVRRVANAYLIDERVVLSVVPQGKPEMAAKPEASVKATTGPTGSPSGAEVRP